MNKEEKINTLKNMLNCYLHATNLTNKEMEESEKFTDELIEDICNTRCCTELNADEKNKHFINGYRQGYSDAMEDIKK
jgi:hypothetical protein